MPSLTVHCPQCNTSLTVTQKGPGPIKGKCPKCQTRLEMTLPAPDEAPSGKDSDAVQTPMPRPVKTADTPASGNALVARWLAVGGTLVVVLAVASFGCIGIGIWWFVVATNQGQPGQDVAAFVKNDSLKKMQDGDNETPLPQEKEDHPSRGTRIPEIGKKKPLLRRRRDNQLTEEALAERARIIPFEAVGSLERLKEIQVVQISGKASFFGASNVNDVVITWESVNRLKFEEITPTGITSFVIIRDHGWFQNRGKIEIMEQALLLNMRNGMYPILLGNLSLLTEKGFETTRGEDRLIHGKKCFNVLLKQAGRKPIELFFDKETNLLFYAVYPVQGKSKDLATEIFFSDYQVADGLNHWRKFVLQIDGKMDSELMISGVKTFNYADDAFFVPRGLEQAVAKALVDEKRDMIKQVLSQLEPGVGSDFSRLVQGLSHHDTDIRTSVHNALLIYTDLARKDQLAPLERMDVDSLVTLLKSGENAELRSFAIENVTRLGPSAVEACSALVLIARDNRDSKVLAGALVALKSIGAKKEEALTLFAKYLDHPEDGVKNPAALALLELGPERLQINQVMALMASPNQGISSAAGKLLRQKLSTVTTKDLPALQQGLKNPTREVRLALIDAIGSLKEAGRVAAPDLISFLGSSDKEASNQVIQALEGMGKLVDIARENSDPNILEAVLAALKNKGVKTEETLTIYEKHLDHPQERIKNLAALALLDLEPERLPVDRVIELMGRSHEEIRAAGGKLLRQKLTTLTVKDLATLRKGVKNPVREVQLAFDEAMRSLKNANAHTYFVALFGSPDFEDTTDRDKPRPIVITRWLLYKKEGVKIILRPSKDNDSKLPISQWRWDFARFVYSDGATMSEAAATRMLEPRTRNRFP